MAHCIDGGERASAYEASVLSPTQLVMGVHWSPAADRAIGADLDALCVLYDAHDRILDVIHGGRVRNENESVVHTGDSRDGASHWDDERIFVFSDAIPDAIAQVAFVVVCADGRAFHEIPGAVCHLTDHASGHELMRLDLTTLCGRCCHTVATLRRMGRIWSLLVSAVSAACAVSDKRSPNAPGSNCAAGLNAA